MTLPVTVVVPTHDRPESLARAVRSVLLQSHPPASIVVVDDTGSALPVAERFGVRYARSWSQTAGASRNLGAALAETPLIAFLDDDDTWLPSFLSRTCPLLDTADLASSWTFYSRGGHRRPGCALPAGLSAAEVLHHNPGLTGSNLVIRADAFRRIGGFDATLPVNNDLDLFVRALDAGLRYAVVPDRLVVQHSAGAGHLSSRGSSRAVALERYRRKYRDRLSRSQDRFLRRERYVALKFPDQDRRRRIGYALLGWLNASPRQCADLVLHRLRGFTPFYD